MLPLLFAFGKKTRAADTTVFVVWNGDVIWSFETAGVAAASELVFVERCVHVYRHANLS